MSTPKRIGILTGGGDVPGLNACIKAAVTRVVGDDAEHEVVGIRRGWGGLVGFDPDDPGGLDWALRRALTDPSLRAELAARGPVRAARFSWGGTAGLTLDAIEEVGCRK